MQLHCLFGGNAVVIIIIIIIIFIITNDKIKVILNENLKESLNTIHKTRNTL